MWRESSGEKIVSVYSVVEEKGRKKKRWSERKSGKKKIKSSQSAVAVQKDSNPRLVVQFGRVDREGRTPAFKITTLTPKKEISQGRPS